jgi:hypothetical protein
MNSEQKELTSQEKIKELERDITMLMEMNINLYKRVVALEKQFKLWPYLIVKDETLI